ncbi:MAG: VTT domain-containing protein [Planctomycetota bacterium]
MSKDAAPPPQEDPGLGAAGAVDADAAAKASKAADRLFTLGLSLYLGVIGLGLLLRSLPEALAGWLVDNLYASEQRLLPVAIAALGAILLAFGITLSIGHTRLMAGVRLLRELGPAGVLGLLWTAMPPVSGTLLVVYIGDISAFLERQGPAGLVLYVVIFILSAGLGCLPTYAQAILGGWAFGTTVGFLAAWVGFLGGSLIGFHVARTVSKQRVQRVIARNAKAQAIRDALIGHGLARTTLIVALLRLPPNSPFALTNLAMASSGVRALPFAVGTAMGMAPRTFIAVLLAAEAAKRGDDIGEVLGRDPIMVVAGLGVAFVALGIIGMIAKRALARVTAASEAPAAGPA